MKTLETDRLILRKFTPEDFAAVHDYASCRDNIIYMPWGPNTEDETRAFIARAMEGESEYAIVLKATGGLIGGCGITVRDKTGELGWILHRDHWRQGYCTEAGRELLRFGFEELGLHRITAICDAGNAASYGVMEKIGMRREAYFIEGRPAHKGSAHEYSDELRYGILKSEFEAGKDIAKYNALPCVFDDFIDVSELREGEIHLVCNAKKPADLEKGYVPGYNFVICKGGEIIGAINLRIGYNERLYYGGQIGYNVDERYRGRGYAVTACRLLVPVARAHGMNTLLITNDHDNLASRRVCEKLGARFVRLVRVPAWHDIYERGGRFLNVYEWSVE